MPATQDDSTATCFSNLEKSLRHYQCSETLALLIYMYVGTPYRWNSRMRRLAQIGRPSVGSTPTPSFIFEDNVLFIFFFVPLLLHTCLNNC